MRQTLRGANTRQVQRRRLIVVLAAAQFALALAAAPGYVIPQIDLVGLSAVAGAVLISLAALAVARLVHGVTFAAYVLVVGGILVTAAHLALTGLAGDPAATAQAALFFLPLILEAGVLFTSEITLGLVGLSLTLTAAALLFALSQASVVPGNEIYLAVVDAMSLQALAGLVAWLVAQFLAESAAEAQRAVRLNMADLQLDALQSRLSEQQRRLQTEVRALQDAITGVLSGAYVDRVEAVPGELFELMQSFNLLLEHLRSVSANDQSSQHPNELVAQMLTVIGEMAEGGSSPSRVVPLAAAGPLSAVLHALVKLQGQSAARYAQLQELVGDVAGAVQTGIDGLVNTAEDSRSATRLAGRMVAAVEQLARGAGSSHALVLHARDAVGKLLPPALVQAAAQDSVHRDASSLTPDEAAKLLGHADDLAGLDVLDADATGEFDILGPTDFDDGEPHGLPSLTIPLPVVGAGEDGAGASGEMAGGALAQRETQAHLLELWRMLDRLATTLGREHRGLKSVLRELGKLSRSVRNADAGLAHGTQSLDAARGAVKQLQQAVRPARAPSYTQRPGPTARPLANPANSSSQPGQPGGADSRPRAADLLGLGDALEGPAFSGASSRPSLVGPGVPVDSAQGSAPGADAQFGSFDLRELIDDDLFARASADGAGGDEEDPK